MKKIKDILRSYIINSGQFKTGQFPSAPEICNYINVERKNLNCTDKEYIMQIDYNHTYVEWEFNIEKIFKLI